MTHRYLHVMALLLVCAGCSRSTTQSAASDSSPREAFQGTVVRQEARSRDRVLPAARDKKELVEHEGVSVESRPHTVDSTGRQRRTTMREPVFPSASTPTFANDNTSPPDYSGVVSTDTAQVGEEASAPPQSPETTPTTPTNAAEPVEGETSESPASASDQAGESESADQPQGSGDAAESAGQKQAGQGETSELQNQEPSSAASSQTGSASISEEAGEESSCAEQDGGAGGAQLARLNISEADLGEVKQRRGSIGGSVTEMAAEETAIESEGVDTEGGDSGEAIGGTLELSSSAESAIQEDLSGWAVAPTSVDSSSTGPGTSDAERGGPSGSGGTAASGGASETSVTAAEGAGLGGAGVGDTSDDQEGSDGGMGVEASHASHEETSLPSGQQSADLAREANPDDPAVIESDLPEEDKQDPNRQESVEEGSGPSDASPIDSSFEAPSALGETDQPTEWEFEDFSLDDLDESLTVAPDHAEVRGNLSEEMHDGELEPWHKLVRGTWEMESLEDSSNDFLPTGPDKRLIGIDPDRRVCRVLLGWIEDEPIWMSGEFEVGFTSSNVEVRAFVDRPSEFLDRPGGPSMDPPGLGLPCELRWHREGDRLVIGGVTYRSVDPSMMMDVIQQPVPVPFDGDLHVENREATISAPTVDFFGLQAEGRYIAYIVDLSRSMAGPKLARLRYELERSLGSLPRGTRFVVLPFSNELLDLQSKWTAASPGRVREIGRKLSAVGAHGGTNPTEAFEYAFRGIDPRPDEIFFMTDGRVSKKTNLLPRLDVLNASTPRTRIHAVGLGRNADMVMLRELARRHGGGSTLAE